MCIIELSGTLVPDSSIIHMTGRNAIGQKEGVQSDIRCMYPSSVRFDNLLRSESNHCVTFGNQTFVMRCKNYGSAPICTVFQQRDYKLPVGIVK